MKQVVLKIFGQVQGVGLRHAIFAMARQLKLTGWVKNLADGTVEVLAQGQEKELKKIISWIKTGNGYAEIKKIEEHWQQIDETINDFEIKYD